MELPWGAAKAAAAAVSALVDPALQPGQFAAQSLIADFVVAADRKLNAAAQEELSRYLTKSLQRGEDYQFDNILRALSGVSEYCLPSVLRALDAWYKQQQQYCLWLQQRSQQQQAARADVAKPNAKGSDARHELITRDYANEKRALAVDFIYCLALLEVLPQLYLHPGHDELVNDLVQLAFRQFQYKDPAQVGPNLANAHIVGDLYAEVVGTLGQSRFGAVTRKFALDLAELRQHERDGNAVVTQNIIGLLMGIKFMRIKTNQVAELEQGLAFLHTLGQYFLEVKEKDIKHHIAGVLVEILLPLAGQVKNEVNVPKMISFVELLHSHTLELASSRNKKNYRLAAFPLLTCLLCISQNKFFLSNWLCFVTLCLSHLRSRDKMARVALESLYRLLWVYVIRLKCESNTTTHSRLQSICSSLFPKAGRSIIPRDMPLNIFVKVIHFIAQEKLDFAFKEIIFDLLCVNRSVRTVYPERMNVGLRALMVIADGLQQKEGAPPMPRSAGPVVSGTIMRVKKTYLTTPLTSEVARSIGLEVYYAPCRRAFDGILRALDLQVGRPLMLSVAQSSGKEPDELLGGERKAKLELFRTCVAAIPRLVPDGMSHDELIDLVARMTIHMEDELRALACQTLQNLITECPDWREDVIHGFLQFISRDIHDGFPQLLDNAARLLLQLLCAWKNCVAAALRREAAEGETSATAAASRIQLAAPLLNCNGAALALHCVEGLALVILCQGRAVPRKLSVSLLREVKSLLPLLCTEGHDKPLLDVLDAAVPHVLMKYMLHLPESDRAQWLASSHCDLAFVCERIPSIEINYSLVNSERGNEYLQWDTWAVALSGFLERQSAPEQSPTAVAFAWPLVYARLNACFGFVDPNNPQNDSRASLLRSSKSKATSHACGDPLNYNHYLSLWQKYLVLACAVAPPPASMAASVRNLGPTGGHETGVSPKGLELRMPQVANVSAQHLFKLVIPLIQSQMTDMRDIVVLGLGSVNPYSFECLLDELSANLSQAVEKKQENPRRRKRRDQNRLQIIRLLEVVFFRGTLPLSCLLDHGGQLKPVLLDFIDGALHFLESDQDRDAQIFMAMRLHFSKMINLLINALPADRRVMLLPEDRKQKLFFLFTSWCSRLGLALDRKHNRERDYLSWGEHEAVSALCAVLCCGAVFEAAKAIGDDGYLYGWLDALLASQNEQVQPLSEQTLAMLLEFNADTGQLLDWVVDRCYTAPAAVADKCFRALAAVFAHREYPCDIVSMFALTLMYAGYPVTAMQQLAVELLQVLEQRFFGESDDVAAEPSNGQKRADVLKSKTSQLQLSQQLAELHPEMTLPVLSEVSQRLEGAKAARRAAMLQYLAPWLRNVELVDVDMEPVGRSVTLSLATKIAESRALARRVLKGDGWGSAPASEMTLNNLTYISVRFGNEHALLVEQLWANLIAYWPLNLRIVLRYLCVIGTLSPDNLLPYAKRVVVFLARVNPERLVEELINELQTIDSFRSELRRSDMAPFYRWVHRGDETTQRSLGGEGRDGVIHTRRHEPSESDGAAPSSSSSATDSEEERDMEPACVKFDCTAAVDVSASLASLVTLKADILNAPATAASSDGSADERAMAKAREHLNAFPLPMPAYGGYYCPLHRYLSGDAAAAVVPFHRCHLGVFLLADLVLSDVEIEWSVHLPLMLHTALLGLDSCRPLVSDHCKQLLLNLLVAHSGDSVAPKRVAGVLLTNALGASQLSLAASSAAKRSVDSDGKHPQAKYLREECDDSDRFGSVDSRASTLAVASEATESSVGSSRSETPAPAACKLSGGVIGATFTSESWSADSLVVGLADCLTAKPSAPLWPSDDLTAKCWVTAGSEQLATFVSRVGQAFALLFPAARVENRWAQTAMQVALSCSNRHYAGRSFQVFRALRCPPSTRMVSDILSRLVETVGEQADEMLQGYVTEILLTLNEALVHMETSEHAAFSMLREQGEGASPTALATEGHASPTHCRSTSYSTALLVQKRPSPAIERKDVRNSTGVDDLRSLHQQQLQSSACNLSRSKSAQALKTVPEGQEEHIAAITQLLWIATSLLESDLEHELLLSLHLLDKVLELPAFERQDCLERLDRMAKQLPWTGYPGLLSLVLKGCFFPVAYELTVALLIKMLSLLDFLAVDPNDNGFAMIVIAVLPCLILHYDRPTVLCLSAADAIAERCEERLSEAAVRAQQSAAAEHPLEHLATVMRLYSKRSFSRDCAQWTKCVVKYLHDSSRPLVSGQLLVLLAEMLERTSTAFHLPLLQIIHYLLHHVELWAPSSTGLNVDVLRVVGRHVQGVNWREASRILKLMVTRNSCLSAPAATAANQAAVDGDPTGRRELAGRTMEFTVDLSALTSAAPAANDPSLSPKKQAAAAGDSSSLKRLNMGQIRVREHLVTLLNASGLRVGLPKSPSANLLEERVIFSQSSHDIAADPASSIYSSSGDLEAAGGASTPSPDAATLGTDFTSDSFPRVFKDFDFLEAEHDSVSESADSGFNWLATMRPRSISNAEDERSRAGSSPTNEPIHSAPSVPSDIGRPSRDADSTDEEESASSQTGCDDEHGGSALSGVDVERLFVRAATPLQSDSRPTTPASWVVRAPAALADAGGRASQQSLCGSAGTPSVDWSVGGGAWPSSSAAFALECTHHATGQVEERWCGTVAELMTDQDGTTTSTATLIFTQLYREACWKVCGLLRDASYYLAMTDIFRDISSQFEDALNVCMRIGECPFLFVTPQTLLSSDLLQRQKYGLFELREHYETFQERREHCIRALNGVKSSLKLQHLGKKVSENAAVDQEIELCRGIHKLFFQLLLMAESFSKLLRHFTGHNGDEQMTNLSLDVLSLHRDILCAVNELSTCAAESSAPPASPTATLMQCLQKRDLKQAILRLRNYRSQQKLDIYGCCEEEDVEALLLLHCKAAAAAAAGQNGMFAIVGSEATLADYSQSLMETNLQLSSLVRGLACQQTGRTHRRHNSEI